MTTSNARCGYWRGINGVFSAWWLAENGHHVELYEACEVMNQTSSNSSKLLHGGIRYLEHWNFSLVRESLLDRAWWMEHAPHLARSIQIAMPVYKQSRRGLLRLWVGAQLYRLLAGKFSLSASKLFRSKESTLVFSELKTKSLSGLVTFYDGQMNEEELGRWVVHQARAAGVEIHENKVIERFDASGFVVPAAGDAKKYDVVVNATGPWASDLNERNEIETKFSLDLVRGSHLLIDYQLRHSYPFQYPESRRVVYVLDYFDNALVGTTEILQQCAEAPICSEDERTFLIDIFNQHFRHQITRKNIIREYSGLRPILRRKDEFRATNFSKTSREAEVEMTGRLVTIYDGKWTSAPSLADKVLRKINGMSL